MRRLILLRHAKSDWSEPGRSDHARILARRGRETAPRVGRYMASQALRPNHAIVSTAARARETWQLVAAELPAPPSVRLDERIYNALPEAILEAIAEAPAGAKTLVVVGHNPGLQELAVMLAGSGDTSVRRQLAEKFPTAALAIIDFDAGDWAALRPHRGRLAGFVTPRAIAEVAD